MRLIHVRIYYVAVAAFAVALVTAFFWQAAPALTPLDAKERVAAAKVCKRFALVNPDRCISEVQAAMREQEVVPR